MIHRDDRQTRDEEKDTLFRQFCIKKQATLRKAEECTIINSKNYPETRNTFQFEKVPYNLQQNSLIIISDGCFKYGHEVCTIIRKSQNSLRAKFTSSCSSDGDHAFFFKY